MDDLSPDLGNCEDRWRDEIAAYALGVLEPAGAAGLESHLRECPRCTERVRWLQPAVDLIPASVRQILPPPVVRENLMAIVHEEAPAATRPAAAASAAIGERLRAWLQGAFSPRPAFAALAAVLAIAAGVTGYELRNDEALAPSVRTVDVRPTTPRIDASGSLVLHGDSAVMQLSQLPQLPPDKVYQAWIRTGRSIEPATVFVPNSWGVSSAGIVSATGVNGGLEGADEVMVTREPAGGSETPQSVVILSAQLG